MGGRTWRRREKGRHDLNVAFASMLVMKDWQLVVMFPLNPRSNGDGRSVETAWVAAAMLPLLDVDDGTVELTDVLNVVACEELALSALLCLRSSSASGTASWPAGAGGGLRSTRMVPDRARRANVDSSVSTSRASTICSSMKKCDADESETQQVRRMKRRKREWGGRSKWKKDG